MEAAASAMPRFADGLQDDDFDHFDLDLDDFDLAGAKEFCDAFYAALLAADGNRSSSASSSSSSVICSGAAPAGGWFAGPCGCGDGVDVGRGGSPDSAVTDGPLAPPGGDDDDDEAMTAAYASELERILLSDDDEAMLAPAYVVSDLERFLLSDDDDDDDGQAATAAEGLAVCVDDYFGDLLDDRDGGNDNGPAAVDAGAAKEVVEENITDANILAALEDDDQTSRKRGRHKIKGTTMMLLPWGELEVTRRHLARIQVPAAPWLPSATDLLVCCV